MLSCAVLAVVLPLPAAVAVGVDDVTQLLAAVLAAGCCWVAGCAGEDRRRQELPGRRTRWAWWLLGAATGAWAGGQAVWTWQELVTGRAVPFPSAADAGFLGFPLLATAGLLVMPVLAGTTRARAGDLLDALTMSASLLVISYASSLGATLAGGSGGAVATALAVAYPLGDVVVITVALLVVGRAQRTQRAVLVPLTTGLVAIAVADSAFLHLTATGSYASGRWSDLGWTTGFVLIAAAATAAATTPRPRRGPWGEVEAAQARAADRSAVPSWMRLVLPYLPLGTAVLVIAVQLLAGDAAVPAAEVLLGLVLLGLVLVRQFLTLTDNRRLLVQVHTEREAARHQALHDPLTGLANRVLFTDRVTHALTRRCEPGSATSVVFVDLDDFKAVNDTLGHAAGDAVLVCVAHRLRSVLRPQDTIARLGGDEFAVLLEAHTEPVEGIAARLSSALAAPLDLAHTAHLPLAVALRVTASIGAASCGAAEDLVAAEQLLHRADAAMYDAKANGKNHWSIHRPAHDRPTGAPARSPRVP